MTGERNMIRAGYRWDVFAKFACNASGVRVARRKTRRGAQRFADRFGSLNRIPAWLKLQHDPRLDNEPGQPRRSGRR